MKKFYLKSYRQKIEKLRRQAKGLSVPIADLIKHKKQLAIVDQLFHEHIFGPVGKERILLRSVCKLTSRVLIWEKPDNESAVLLLEARHPDIQHSLDCLNFGGFFKDEEKFNELEKYYCWFDYWHKEQTIKAKRKEECRLNNWLDRHL